MTKKVPRPVVRVITLEEQMNLWVAGESVHRAIGGHGHLERSAATGKWRCRGCGATGTLEEVQASNCPLGNYECCPDFSCCYPHLKNSLEQRQEYAAQWRAKKRFVGDSVETCDYPGCHGECKTPAHTDQNEE